MAKKAIKKKKGTMQATEVVIPEGMESRRPGYQCLGDKQEDEMLAALSKFTKQIQATDRRIDRIVDALSKSKKVKGL